MFLPHCCVGPEGAVGGEPRPLGTQLGDPAVGELAGHEGAVGVGLCLECIEAGVLGVGDWSRGLGCCGNCYWWSAWCVIRRRHELPGGAASCLECGVGRCDLDNLWAGLPVVGNDVVEAAAEPRQPCPVAGAPALGPIDAGLNVAADAVGAVAGNGCRRLRGCGLVRLATQPWRPSSSRAAAVRIHADTHISDFAAAERVLSDAGVWDMVNVNSPFVRDVLVPQGRIRTLDDARFNDWKDAGPMSDAMRAR